MSVAQSQKRNPWTLRRTAAPAQRPVTLAEAKQTLRLSQSDTTHDADISDAIDAATEQFEQDTDRIVITQTFEMPMDCFPRSGIPIAFSQKPIQSITSITYLDESGDEQTVDSANYVLDDGRRQVYLKSGQEWPATLYEYNAVTITFVGGYGDTQDNVPRLIKRAILLQVGKWFYDPAMENNDLVRFDMAYERIVNRLLRTSYP